MTRVRPAPLHDRRRLPSGRRPRPAWRQACGLVALGVALAGSAHAAEPAQPLPVPQVAFRSVAKLDGGGTLTARHADGRMRIELRQPDLPVTLTGFLDLAARRLVLLVPTPGRAEAVAFEAGQRPRFGQLLGVGRRTGDKAVVAGEACEMWVPEGGRAARLSVCISADGITLSTTRQDGGRARVLYEVTEIERAPQDPATLDLPPGTPVREGTGGVADMLRTWIRP